MPITSSQVRNAVMITASRLHTIGMPNQIHIDIRHTGDTSQ
jgi:hypothetical protein